MKHLFWVGIVVIVLCAFASPFGCAAPVPSNEEKEKTEQTGGGEKSGESVADSGTRDESPKDNGTDKGPADGAKDAGPSDGAKDAGPSDGAKDAGPSDGAKDAGPSDGAKDAGPSDGAKDAGSGDGAPKDDGRCQAGVMKTCYGGPGGTEGKGECKAGQQTCQSDGTWGACVGEVLPAKDENCDGKDDNCDGAVDEGYVGPGCSVSGQSGPCEKGQSVCKSGQVVCEQQVQPKSETCDGTDEDCNGTVDDNLTGVGTACKVAGEMGVCEEGKTACKGGKIECEATGTKGVEICNGKDDDCNGTVDDSPTDAGTACTVTGEKGPCAASKTVCTAGKITCPKTVNGVAETCNGKDDDCDGSIDDSPTDVGTACTVTGEKGPCAASKTVCTAGKITCPKTVNGVAETCNGKDDDCDGITDNNPTDAGKACVATGLPASCAASKTVCAGAQIVCPKPAASAEMCNGKDDDCDGSIDENCPLEARVNSNTTKTRFYGNSSGGTAYTDRCPTGQAIGGLTITADNSNAYLRTILFHCRKIVLSTNKATSPYTFTITSAAGSDTPRRGSVRSYTKRIDCPANTFFYGFSGRSGGLVDQIRGHCAPLTISATAPFTLVRGTTSQTATAGGNGGNAFGLTACPAPQVANGAFIRAGGGIDGLQLLCSTPQLLLDPGPVVIENTTAQTSFYGNASGGTAYTDRCPTGQAIGGLTITADNSGAYLRTILFHCRIPRLSVNTATTYFTYTITSVAGSDTPRRGSVRAYTKRIDCPVGTFFYGFSGRSGGLVDQIRGHCVALTVSSVTPFTLVRGATSQTATAGGNGGNAFGLTACPAPQVANGAFIRAGGGVDGLRLLCATPKF